MLRDDRRGQSIQIGAILLFGILVIGLSIVQTVVVPAENEGVEFNGYVEASDDLVTLHNDILTAGTRGGEQATSVKTGVRYPARAIFINPGPPVGSLETTPPENVTISGVQAVDGEESNVRGFWDTSARGAQNYSTRSVAFDPAYNTIDVPRVEVSGMGTYRLTANGPLSLTGQSFVTGNRITLVTVEGELGSSAVSTSLSSSPASVATRSVTVTGTGSEFNVTLPVPGDDTPAAAAAWNESRAAESLRANPNVLAVTPVGNRVTVTFDGGQTYELRLANVVVHDAGDSGVDTTTEPAYLIPSEGNGSATPASGARRLSVEVRDRYNNPVSGVEVSFSTSDGTFDATGTGSTTVVTGSDGRAPVSVVPTDSTVEIAASFDGGVTPYNETTLVLTDAAAGAGGDGDGISAINEGSRGVVLGPSTAGGGNDKEIVTVGFNNTSPTDRNISAVRVAFYNPDATSSDDPPSNAEVDNQVTLDVGGDFVTIPDPILLQNNTVTDVEFDFQDPNLDANGDFFILSVEFEDGARSTFFVNVT